MEERRISRRELLRNIGIAGAAAWAAPVMNSLRASASVDRCTKRRAHKLCKYACCDQCFCGSEQCGTCSSDVGDGSFCFMRYGNLKCFCGEDQFCAETHACTSDADCTDFARGICITRNGCTGCDTSTGVCTTRCCTPLAGTAPAPGPRRLGKTASRR